MAAGQATSRRTAVIAILGVSLAMAGAIFFLLRAVAQPAPGPGDAATEVPRLTPASAQPAPESLRANARVPRQLLATWPDTDFSRSSVDFREILSGGVPKDAIRAIDSLRFAPIAEAAHLVGTEPVIGLIVDGVAKAYPLNILIRHEIVNDVIAGVPVAVTFCPLCNTSVVFDARVEDRTLQFGVSGNLRNSDLIMFDRQTESWWQQFTGEAVVGELTGTRLRMLPSRLESWDDFRARAPRGAQVMIPNGGSYGRNPYAYYDTAARPFRTRGRSPMKSRPWRGWSRSRPRTARWRGGAFLSCAPEAGSRPGT